MINDFSEIKNEKDRECYVMCRQILDGWFLQAIEEHKKKDHNLNNCFIADLKEFKKSLDIRLKEEQKALPNMPKLLMVEAWLMENYSDLIDKFMAIAALNDRKSN